MVHSRLLLPRKETRAMSTGGANQPDKQFSETFNNTAPSSREVTDPVCVLEPPLVLVIGAVVAAFAIPISLSCAHHSNTHAEYAVAPHTPLVSREAVNILSVAYQTTRARYPTSNHLPVYKLFIPLPEQSAEVMVIEGSQWLAFVGAAGEQLLEDQIVGKTIGAKDLKEIFGSWLYDDNDFFRGLVDAFKSNLPTVVALSPDVGWHSKERDEASAIFESCLEIFLSDNTPRDRAIPMAAYIAARARGEQYVIPLVLSALAVGRNGMAGHQLRTVLLEALTIEDFAQTLVARLRLDQIAADRILANFEDDARQQAETEYYFRMRLRDIYEGRRLLSWDGGVCGADHDAFLAALLEGDSNRAEKISNRWAGHDVGYYAMPDLIQENAVNHSGRSDPRLAYAVDLQDRGGRLLDSLYPSAGEPDVFSLEPHGELARRLHAVYRVVDLLSHAPKERVLLIRPRGDRFFDANSGVSELGLLLPPQGLNGGGLMSDEALNALGTERRQFLTRLEADWAKTGWRPMNRRQQENVWEAHNLSSAPYGAFGRMLVDGRGRAALAPGLKLRHGTGSYEQYWRKMVFVSNKAGFNAAQVRWLSARGYLFGPLGTRVSGEEMSQQTGVSDGAIDLAPTYQPRGSVEPPPGYDRCSATNAFSLQLQEEEFANRMAQSRRELGETQPSESEEDYIKGVRQAAMARGCELSEAALETLWCAHERINYCDVKGRLRYVGAGAPGISLEQRRWLVQERWL